MSDMEIQVTLTVVEGENKGLSVRLGQPRTIIGRKDVDFLLTDKKISHQHAAIEIHGHDVTIMDLDSRNGVIVNGEPVKRASLKNLDEIQLSLTKLKILIVEDLDAFKRRNKGENIFDVDTKQRRDIHSLIDDELKRFSKWDLSEPADKIIKGTKKSAVTIGLEVIEGVDAGKKIRIEQEQVTLGRGKADISFRDGDISRVHATINVRGKGHVTIHDNNSTNGTFVNRKKVSEAKLKTGDIIQIGGTLCRFVMED